MSNDDILQDYIEASKGLELILIDKDTLTCVWKHTKKREVFFFKDLTDVAIITTDKGPIECDVFFLLRFMTPKEIPVMIPQELFGAYSLLDRLQKLPGFDNNMVVKAMGSAENRTFIVWKKEISNVNTVIEQNFKFCPYCNFKNKKSNNFCISCGTPLN